MTCSIPEGVELRFPRSGIRVRPYEGDVKIQKRNYAEAEFVLSEKAGQLIGDSVENKEPVIFVLDADDIYRFIYLEDSLDFRRNFDRENESILKLHDARAVLADSALSKRWFEAELDTIVSYIRDNSDDPHGVIESIQYAGDVDADQLIETVGDVVPIESAGRLFDITSLPENVIKLKDGLGLSGSLVVGEEGIEFDDISPLEALEKVASELEYSFWIDVDGTLYVGLDETWGQSVRVADRTSFSVRRLDILEPKHKVNTVVAKAPQQASSGDWFPDPVLRSVAEAEATDIDGGTLAVGVKKGQSLENIKKVAQRRLIKEISSDISGSGVFNGLASDHKDVLARLTVGDHFIIADSAFDSCRTGAAGGHYTVKSVHHRINPRQGWRIDVDFGRIPENIETRSFYYDPQDDKRYETVSAYSAGRARPRL